MVIKRKVIFDVYNIIFWLYKRGLERNGIVLYIIVVYICGYEIMEENFLKFNWVLVRN